MIKIVIVEGSLNHTNRGINAITRGTIFSIVRNFPEFSVEIFIFRLGKTNAQFKHTLIFNGYNVSVCEGTVKYYFSFIFTFLSFILQWLPKKWIRRILRKLKVLNILLDADIIIDISQGDSFADIYGTKQFFYMFFNKFVAKCCGIKYIFFPQTIGPFKNKIIRKLAGHILSGAEMVFVREGNSWQYLNNIFDGKINLKLASDQAFLMPPEKVDDADLDRFIKENKSVIGFNISGFLASSSKIHDQILGKNIDYTESIESVINHYCENSNLGVLFIPHTNQDYVVSLYIYNRIQSKYEDKIFLIKPKYNEAQLKYIISKCDFFVGSRMHACIAALSSYVPTIPIGYSHKFDGIMKQLGLEQFVVIIQGESSSIVEKIKKAFESKDSIKQRLQKIIPPTQEAALECSKVLYGIIR